MPTSFTTVSNGQTIQASHINELHAPINTLETTVAGLGSPALANISDWPSGLTATELSYVDGVTSSIQTQLNGKAASSHTHTISQISDWPAGLTATELGYMDGVTSSVQTQLDGKSGTGHNHTITALTDWPAGLTTTELGYVDGVTSAIQTQLDGKAATSHTHTISQISDWPAGLTATELGYVDGVTSSVQTQINGKAATAHTHSASDINSGTLAVARGGTGLGSLGSALQSIRVNSGATALEFYTPVGGGANALDDLSDVAISSPATGNFLRYNGSNFINVNLVAGDIPSTLNSHTVASVVSFSGGALVSGAAIGRNTFGHTEIAANDLIVLSPTSQTYTTKPVSILTADVAVAGTTFTTVRAIYADPQFIFVKAGALGGALLFWNGSTLSVWKGLADANIVAAASANAGEVAWRVSGGNLQASNNTGSSVDCSAGLAVK